MHADIPQGKQTALKLYVTSSEAYEKWQANPEKVKIIDVRTVEEMLFVGHPPMAWKVPIFAQGYEWQADQAKYPMQFLADFVTRVQTIAQPDDVILTLCRSGGRSAIAANMLAEAGFELVYNIIDGMEGDVNGDSESVACHPHAITGWKNSGCPWTKQLKPERLVLPTAGRD